jgi:hypothetical protein
MADQRYSATFSTPLQWGLVLSARAGFGIGEDLFQHLGIEHQGLDVITH